jgi:hypothetical protein
MRTYEPQIEVRLVKAIKRTEIIPDVPVVDRYKRLKAIDLTPYLGEAGGVHISKGIREPAGAWSVTISDQEHPRLSESIYALIEPMDLIEIRMAHDPYEYGDNDNGCRPPVVMRGFVSMITRNEAMSGGKPMRTVTASGQDFGKILQIIQIFYLNNSHVGDNILSELAFFHKYGQDGQAKLKPAIEFVSDVLNGVINPYLAKITALAKGESIGAKVVNVMTPDVTIKGTVSPYAIAQFNNVSLYQMLTSLLDVGAFNELYVEDTEDGISLVVRPAPFLDVQGKEIQKGAFPMRLYIDSTDVIAINVSRTDAGVANYFWVQNSAWAMYHDETVKALASVGSASSFIKFEYLNSQMTYYGVRKMEVSTSLLPPEYGCSDSVTKEQMPTETGKLSSWIETRRKILADTNKDNVIFESGSIRLRGNERIKAGMLLVIKRGSNMQSSYYVTMVEHDFVPFEGFYTNVTVERGTNFITRSQNDESVYRLEIDGMGV